MRFSLPEDCAGVTHAGAMLRRREDGTIEAAAESAAALAPHGIMPVADAPPPPRKRGAADKRMLR